MQHDLLLHLLHMWGREILDMLVGEVQIGVVRELHIQCTTVVGPAGLFVTPVFAVAGLYQLHESVYGEK